MIRHGQRIMKDAEFTRTKIRLKIRPGAKRTGFAGQVGGVWKLHVAAPPVDGKANEALIRFLAKLTRQPVGAIRIVSGLTTPMKTVEVSGMSAESLDRAILESHGPHPNAGI